MDDAALLSASASNACGVSYARSCKEGCKAEEALEKSIAIARSYSSLYRVAGAM